MQSQVAISNLRSRSFPRSLIGPRGARDDASKREAARGLLLVFVWLAKAGASMESMY